MHAPRTISGRCSLSTGILVALDSLFPVLTSDRSERKSEEGGGDAGEGGAIRATAAATTSALATATAAS